MENTQAIKRTKVVATIGPASENEETISKLIRAGANVFRFNMKHADIAWHNERIGRVQRVADKLGVPIGILIDLQGPEIRVETLDKADVPVQKDGEVVFAERLSKKEPHLVCIPHRAVFNVLAPGDTLLIDDGFLEFAVTSVDHGNRRLTARALDDCVIKHRKGLNLPGKKLRLPSLVPDDLKKLDMAVRTKVDFVALSFARTKRDIDILRQEMKKRNVEAMVVAKIESQQALDNLDDLISAADAIMVARGDLGIEVPIEEIAFWQKHIITKCRAARKPVITATQMLQSMVENPRPTRAEATDVANAVFDGTDAVMLSAETAAGRFPVKAVRAMTLIARFNEEHAVHERPAVRTKRSTSLIVEAAVSIAETVSAPRVDAFLVFTETGRTARVLSSLRPRTPIIAVTENKKAIEELTLSYGVNAHYAKFPSGAFISPEKVIHKLITQGVLKHGETVLVIHGKQWKTPGLTNALTLLEV